MHAIPRGKPWLAHIKTSPILQLGMVGLGISFIFLTPQQQVVMLPLGVLTLLYIAPVFTQKRKLRDFPFVKIFILSLVLALIVVVLPAWLHHTNTMVLIFMTVSRFIFFFALCLLFDIRDFEKDKRSGIKTLATHYSLRTLKISGIFLAIILMIFEVYLANHFIIDLENMIAMIIASLAILIYFSGITVKTRTTLFSFLCDGIIALPFLIDYLIH